MVPLGQDCYVATQKVVMIYPWDEEGTVDLSFPGHGNSTGKTVVELADGRKALVGLKPETVAARYAKAIQGGSEPTWSEGDEV